MKKGLPLFFLLCLSAIVCWGQEQAVAPDQKNTSVPPLAQAVKESEKQFMPKHSNSFLPERLAEQRPEPEKKKNRFVQMMEHFYVPHPNPNNHR